PFAPSLLRAFASPLDRTPAPNGSFDASRPLPPKTQRPRPAFAGRGRLVTTASANRVRLLLELDHVGGQRDLHLLEEEEVGLDVVLREVDELTGTIVEARLLAEVEQRLAVDVGISGRDAAE